MSDNSSNGLLALLAGVAIGAGLGILFAPDSGQRTRQKIRDNFDEYAGDLQQQLRDLEQRIRSAAGAQRAHWQETVDDLHPEAAHDAEALIAHLEARLEQLKAGLAQGRDTTP